MKDLKNTYLIQKNTITGQILSISLKIFVLVSFSIINYTPAQAQSFPVTITASGATNFCSPGTVTLSTPLSQTGTTSQLAPNAGTASDCNCPAGYVAIGISGRTGFWIDQFSLVCQQLSPTGTLFGPTVITNANGLSAGGSNAGPYNLPAGNVMVGGFTDYYTWAAGQNYLESVGLKGQTPAYIIANGNNATSPTTTTPALFAGNQTPTGSLGTQYAPAGSVITGMRSFDKTYSAGVQWIYTPISQIMTTYLWSPGGETTRSITVSTSNTYSVTATAGYATGSDSKVVTVSSTPATPTSYSTFDASVCQGENNVSYVVSPVAGATSYVWSYTGSGENITVTSNTASVDFASNATAGNMRVAASNSCGTSANLSAAVAMNTVPGRPGNGVNGTSPICQGVTGSYTVPTATGATSYTWTYGGTGATINGTTNSITVDFDYTATSGALVVYGTNACGNSTQNRSMNITIRTAPAQPSVINPNNATPCNTSTGNTYTVTNAGGGVSYAWTYGGTGSSITSGSTSNSITVSYSGATNGTWTVVPSNANCSGPSRTYTTNLQSTGTWLGNTSTSWNTTTNWGCGNIPTSTTDVVFPSTATNMPTIPASSTANARNLTINNSASLTITASGSLNVYGNFVNNGTFTDNNIYTSGGKVSFSGTSGAQSITGTTSFSNVSISNASGVNIPAGNATTINGILTLNSGVFATNGNLSQNLYNGAISATGAGTGTVTGSIRFFKTIWGDRYHYISLPTSTTGLTTAQWTDNVLIKSGSASNLYSYNEANPDSSQKVGWTAVAPGTTLTPMTGYALYFPRWVYNTMMDVSTSYDHATTSVSSGVLKNTPSTTPAPRPTSDGWNLLGNPFPTTIDWTLVAAADRVGLNNAVYAYDTRRMLYTAYAGGVPINGGSQYIGSMQGFFVKVISPSTNGNLTLRNAARVTSTLRDVWRTQGSSDKRLRLTVANGSYADELVVRFTEEATEQFDSEYDGFKIINDAAVPSLFAYTAEANYCVNSLPSSLTEKTIPLQLNVASDTLCTWTADMSGFSRSETMMLEDRLLGTSQNLSENPTYMIQLKKGVYSNRFFLQYSNREELVTDTKGGSTADASIDIAAVQQNVIVLFTNQNPGDANIAVFDALGKKVYEAQNVSTASGKVEINFQDISNGIYIVKVQTPSAIRSQQVYLIK